MDSINSKTSSDVSQWIDLSSFIPWTFSTETTEMIELEVLSSSCNGFLSDVIVELSNTDAEEVFSKLMKTIGFSYPLPNELTYISKENGKKILQISEIFFANGNYGFLCLFIR